MAKPRVFVSSTYYDLKHVRSSLDIFIESLGFEPVLSEKGDIAFTPDIPLDESCYREASNADLFVLILGGRYGTEASGKRKTPAPSFFDRYESITKKEYESALSRDIPIYILVEASVYSEYQTYLRNKENKSIAYAHVDSVNVFRLIEEILSRPRNNPTHTFERFSDMENWLREQWAGLFRELLQRQSQQQQMATLAGQVRELREINETLRRYLEAVMKGITPAASSRLIESEERRLQEIERNEQIKANHFFRHVNGAFNMSLEDFLKAVTEAKSSEEFAARVEQLTKGDERVVPRVKSLLDKDSVPLRDLNEVRALMGLRPFVHIREEKSKRKADSQSDDPPTKD